MATILKRSRPRVWNDVSQDEGDAGYLLVTVDIYDDGSVELPMAIQLADYPGLEAEYDAASATTVLEAAVEDVLGLTSGQAGSGTRDDPEQYVPAEA